MKRPREHVRETKSIKIFIKEIPDEWIWRKIDEDYGVDMEVEIVSGGEVTGKTFLVQLKSSESFSPKEGFVHFSFDTKKLSYYLERDVPVILTLVDLAKEQCYWIFVQEYIYEELDKVNPLWRQQKSIVLKIPTGKVLSHSLNMIKDLAYRGPFYLLSRKLSSIQTGTLEKWRIDARTRAPHDIPDFSNILVHGTLAYVAPLRDLVFDEFVHSRRSRYECLKQEYLSLRANWENLSAEHRRILPETDAFEDVRTFLDNISTAFDKIKHLSNRPIEELSKVEIQEKEKLSRTISNGLAVASGLLTFVRTSFYERLALLQKPRMVEPTSTHFSDYADELVLLAMDNLVRSYLRQLDMHRKVWDNFVSYHQPNPYEFSGLTYTNFRKTFHLSLSLDMKYFIPSYVSLAHGVAHAACESRWISINRKEYIPLVTYRFLNRLFFVRHVVWREMGKIFDEKFCEGCVYRDDLRMINRISSTERFIRTAAFQTSLLATFYQILADVVALVVAGPNYLRALSNFGFDSILTYDHPGSFQQVVLQDHFVGAVTRISACAAYAEQRDFKWKDACHHILTEIDNKALHTLQYFSNKEKHLCGLCLRCSKKLGELVGIILGIENEEIFGDVFLQQSTLRIKKRMMKELRMGRLIVEEEPREILHAYIELLRQKQHPNTTTLLRSLAGNRARPSSL